MGFLEREKLSSEAETLLFNPAPTFSMLIPFHVERFFLVVAILSASMSKFGTPDGIVNARHLHLLIQMIAGVAGTESCPTSPSHCKHCLELQH